MTKHEMAHAIAVKTGVDQQTVRQIVQWTLDEITCAIVAERRLELREFGIFEIRMRKERIARNPRSGAVIFVPSKQKVFFKAGKKMEEKVNGGTKRLTNAAQFDHAISPPR